MTRLGHWLDQQRRVYLGNASSVRDFRAQLRGTRPILFWSIYLGLLILFVVLAYANIVAQGEQSVTIVQTQLKSFYTSILMMLEVMVALVAPVIVVMSIQAEVQRKSYDLVVTSPVTPKYFLIGKVLSGYRYVLMLIFLSLPVTAAAVVLGGATYSDVLISYWMIAMHGLLYIAISLPIAMISTKVVPAVIYSYIACWGYALFVGSGAGALFYAVGMMSRGGSGQEAPFFLLLTPVMVGSGVSTYTVLFPASVAWHMPNWIIATAVILLAVRFLVSGAGSAMTRAGSKETKSLRIHGLVFAGLLTTIFAFAQFSVMGTGSSLGIGFSSNPARDLAVFLLSFTMLLIFVMPYLSTWSYNDERKHRPAGFFDLRQVFSGTPEGGLPYLLLVLATIFICGSLVWKFYGGPITVDTVIYYLWIAGCWVFIWSLGWLVSSFIKTGSGTAKKAHVSTTVIVGLLPWPVLAIVATMTGSQLMDVLKIYPFASFLYEIKDIDIVIFAVCELLVSAVALTIWAESRRNSVVSLYKRAIHAGQ